MLFFTHRSTEVNTTLSAEGIDTIANFEYVPFGNAFYAIDACKSFQYPDTRFCCAFSALLAACCRCLPLRRRRRRLLMPPPPRYSREDSPRRRRDLRLHGRQGRTLRT